MIHIIGYTLVFIFGIWVGVTFSNNYTKGLYRRMVKKLKEADNDK